MVTWRRAEEDKVTPELYRAVMVRDGGCVPALYLRAPGFCRNRWGRSTDAHDLRPEAITLMHVHDGSTARMGRRADSDLDHCAAGCWGHGVQGWELGHLAELQAYLRDPRAWQDWAHRGFPRGGEPRA